MAARKKSKPTRHTKSPIIVVYKYIIVSLIIVLVGASLSKVFTSILGGQQVLGVTTLLARGGDDNGGNSESGSSGSDSDDSEDSDSDNDSGSSESGFENKEVKFEARTSETDRIKIKTEDNKTKVEIRTGGVKTKIESRDGRTIVKQEEEDESEDEFEFEMEIEDEIEVATDGGSFHMSGKHLGAKSHFPISIDLATNALIITTPAGTKTVAILPDVAVQNMITKGIISKIGGHVISASGSAEPEDEDDDSASESGDLENGEIAENIELTEEDGVPVYKIKGQKEKRFFGLIPVAIDKVVTVSAETGEIESTQLSPFERFLDLLSL